jgi:Trk-type K+ transport system membrane component
LEFKRNQFTYSFGRKIDVKLAYWYKEYKSTFAEKKSYENLKRIVITILIVLVLGLLSAYIYFDQNSPRKNYL